ncbi:unnamed protein product [Moneuplotes crassus]|uniref:Uncharacterized protein n=1 Tax=Euplotes crassus TaxID=5936 RepID=A0AAD1X6E7_EUPCR|nr:unnamed protein product [Moneuplotes crassus]
MGCSQSASTVTMRKNIVVKDSESEDDEDGVKHPLTYDISEIYQKIQLEAYAHRKAIELYSEAHNLIFKQRAVQIDSWLASLKTHLDRFDPERLNSEWYLSTFCEQNNIKFKQIDHLNSQFANQNYYAACKRQYDSLGNDLKDLLGRSKILLRQVELQQVLQANSSGQSKAKEESNICEEEKNTLKESEEIEWQALSGSCLEYSVDFRDSSGDPFGLTLDEIRVSLGNLLDFKFLKNIIPLNHDYLSHIYCDIDEINQKTLKILAQCPFFKRVNKLFLSFRRQARINMDMCLKQILNASCKIESEFNISGLIITQPSFMKLLCASRNIDKLCLNDCEISMKDVPDFGNIKNSTQTLHTIRSLCFYSSEIIGPSKNPAKIDGFLALIKGLSKSQYFRTSLDYIGVTNSLDLKKVKKILKKYEFTLEN